MQITMLTQSRKRLAGALLVGALGIALTASATSVATAADDPPVVSVGPVTTPDGTTSSGDVQSDGQTDACVNDQHSGADPSSSEATGVAEVNDTSCTTGGSSSGGGTQSASSESGASSGSGGSQPGSAAGGAGQSSGKQTVTVSAADANGIRISGLRYRTRGIRATKRLGVSVTVRDALGRSIQNAIVSLGGVAGAKTTLSCTHATYSNSAGKARFSVPVGKELLGRRLLVRVVGRTPTASARRIGSVRLG
jgi:hypothetical protein